MTDLQREILKVYKGFKAVCDAHDLRYYATGGTKIGAVLWGGFIPWDDDIDLVMPYPDLKKFIRIAKQELDNEFTIFDAVHSTHGDILGIKVCSVNTMFTSNNLIGYPDSFTGVFIDIFPMIGAPEDDKKRRQFIDETTTLKDKMYLKKLFGIGSSMTKQLIAEYDERAEKYAFDKATYVFNPANMHKEEYQRELLLDAENMNFHDTSMPVPKDFDTQLKQQYGSYTKDWPKEKRISNHKAFALYNNQKSYKAYAEAIHDSPIRDYIEHLIEYKINLERNVMDFGERLRDIELRHEQETRRNKEYSEKIAHQQRTIDEKEARIAQMLQSTSWRVTHPLRKLRDIIGRVI